jgi:ribosomal-protein-alanine N-acetyltransferase
MRTLLQARLRAMVDSDIAQVLDIERESFPTMWPQTAYERELANNIARYLVITEPVSEPRSAPSASGLVGAIRRVVRVSPPTETNEFLLGFVGLWLMVREAHIVTVAVRGDKRRQGIGERLLIAAIELAKETDQDVVTLEVRASNDAAQAMYEKYGFDRVGLRKRYYTDDGEDALIMTTPPISDPAFVARFESLRAQHRARHHDLWQ